MNRRSFLLTALAVCAAPDLLRAQANDKESDGGKRRTSAKLKKNWLPLLSRPRLHIESTPGPTCCARSASSDRTMEQRTRRMKFSSSKVVLSPPKMTRAPVVA